MNEHEIVFDYESGMSLRALQAKYHRGQKYIVEVLDRHNIDHSCKRKGRWQWPPERVKALVDDYTVNQLSLKACEEKYKSAQSTLRSILKENGVQLRNNYEAQLAAGVIKSCDHKYFDTESANMAWILGFLAADGTVGLKNNTIKLTVATVDREILEKIRAELKIEREIADYTTAKGYTSSTLAWTCKEHKAKLAEYGIIPQKTFKLGLPTKLSRKFWVDYIRGYFDGDGSVNLIKNSNGRGNGNLRWQIGSATPEILHFINDFFFDEYGIKKVNVREEYRKAAFYVLSYSSVATRKIFEVLYTPDTLRLKRKHQHYTQILSVVAPLHT